MTTHLIALQRPLYVSLGGRRAYSVVALAWDDDTNATRYLVAAPDRPVWVPEQDVVRTSTEVEESGRDETSSRVG
jgi:hypothetical protein